MRRYLPLAFLVAFFLVSYSAFINAKGERKSNIYADIKKYSPYYFEKSLSGLVIKSKENNDFKEKPSNMQVFHEMDRLQKEWGRKHLKIENNKLVIFNKERIIKKIPIKDKKDLNFLHSFYGLE